MKDMNEAWKDIDGYEGLYQISNLGRVKRLEREVNCNSGKMILPEMIMKKSHTKLGYEIVPLFKDKQSKNKLVHRLVAIAFIKNPNNYPCVNHKDETRDNSHIDNLEWCTHSYNNSYGNAIQKRLANTDYEPIWAAKRTPVIQMDKNGGFVRRWDSIKEAAENTKSYTSNIVCCCTGKQRTAKGYRWRYAESVGEI